MPSEFSLSVDYNALLRKTRRYLHCPMIVACKKALLQFRMNGAE
jgi:hypothetical protein